MCCSARDRSDIFLAFDFLDLEDFVVVAGGATTGAVTMESLSSGCRTIFFFFFRGDLVREAMPSFRSLVRVDDAPSDFDLPFLERFCFGSWSVFVAVKS